MVILYMLHGESNNDVSIVVKAMWLAEATLHAYIIEKRRKMGCWTRWQCGSTLDFGCLDGHPHFVRHDIAFITPYLEL